MSDGHIGSGRQHWDGSGGNGSALRHYQAMKLEGKEYPLVVKLGTITPSGADVYSYAPDEDDMVEDPLLAQHLSHWGINMMSMEKTEKSMAELQIDLNKGFDFDKITEAGAELQPVHGARHVGLKNMGNTCYVNSILQVLKEVPMLADTYLTPAAAIYQSAPADPTADFPTQMAKLCTGLISDRYAAPPPEGADYAAVAVQPRMFKQLIGRGHAEFSTGRQQDAVEYFQHLLETMTRAEFAAKDRLAGAPGGPTAAQFEFDVEERVACVESGAVKYNVRKENVLPLMVPVDAATNAAALAEFEERRELKRQKTTEGAVAAPSVDEEETVRPVVPFMACLERVAADETVEDFYSSALGRKGLATKRFRFKTFPNVLAVQVRRYYVGEDWTPRKLDVLVPMPEEISLEHLRGQGLQHDETELPEVDEPTAAVNGGGGGGAEGIVEPDAAIVSQLMGMGFSENGSKRAAIATSNSSAEASMEWVFAHMEDADFNDPVPAAAAATPAPPGAPAAVDPESMMMLNSMGFSELHATAALKSCNGDVERAADWLFSHADDLNGAMASINPVVSNASVGAVPGAGTVPGLDGIGRYELFGVVSHMGGNTACGHYVAHVKTDGLWCIFNDRKVAKSAAGPPLELGYLYFYKRKSV